MGVTTNEDGGWHQGQIVRVVAGPFKGFVGRIYEIDPDGIHVRIKVDFLGRETPVQLDYFQIERYEDQDDSTDTL
jgi:transcription antitermination factor NusG